MKRVLLDTSVIIELERLNEPALSLVKELMRKKEDLCISVITVAELQAGCHLQRDSKKALSGAKEILGQFVWKNIDGETAETLATLYSYLIREKKQNSIEYQDVLIAATFLASRCDFLLTLNKKDFLVFPGLKDKVFTLEEFEKQTVMTNNKAAQKSPFSDLIGILSKEEAIELKAHRRRLNRRMRKELDKVAEQLK